MPSVQVLGPQRKTSRSAISGIQRCSAISSDMPRAAGPKTEVEVWRGPGRSTTCRPRCAARVSSSALNSGSAV